MTRDRLNLFATLRNYAWDQESWFLPLAAALEGVGPAEAAWQPPGGGNTIWETVNHLNYYNERILNRLTGAPVGPAVANNDESFGQNGSPDDAAGWQAVVAKTREVAEGWRNLLAELTDEDLARPFGESTLQDTLLAWIMHDSYHTGQVALIRKMQGSFPAKRG